MVHFPFQPPFRVKPRAERSLGLISPTMIISQYLLNLNGKTVWNVERCALSSQTIFIDFTIGISMRELHHHSPCCPDNLPGRKNICAPFFSSFNTRETSNLLSFFHVFREMTSPVVSWPSLPASKMRSGSVALVARVGQDFPLITYL